MWKKRREEENEKKMKRERGGKKRGGKLTGRAVELQELSDSQILSVARLAQ